MYKKIKIVAIAAVCFFSYLGVSNAQDDSGLLISLAIDNNMQEKYDEFSETGAIPFSINKRPSYYQLEPDLDEWSTWKNQEIPESTISESLPLPITFLSVTVDNISGSKKYINGGNIIVKKSKDDIGIYPVMNRLNKGGHESEIYFENLGSKITSCDAVYKIKGGDGNDEEFDFLKSKFYFKYDTQFNIDMGILDLTDSYNELGVNLAWLKDTGNKIIDIDNYSVAERARNSIKAEVKKALGLLAPDVIPDNFYAYTVSITGQLQCDWDTRTSENNRLFNFSTTNNIYVSGSLDSGAGAPVSAQFDIKFEQNEENYRIPFALEGAIDHGEMARFNLNLGAEYNSIHDFTIALSTIDNQLIESLPVKFNYFNGSTRNNPRDWND